MRYQATHGGRTRTIDLEPLDDGRYRVSLDSGAPFEVDARRPESHVLHLLSGQKSVEADVSDDGEALQVRIRDTTFRVELTDERQSRMQKMGGRAGGAGPQLIRAPMPGKVVKILAPEGTEVAEGQGVIVIEAMKMENELRATRAGRVVRVAVREGQTVEMRADLLTIE